MRICSNRVFLLAPTPFFGTLQGVSFAGYRLIRRRMNPARIRISRSRTSRTIS